MRCLTYLCDYFEFNVDDLLNSPRELIVGQEVETVLALAQSSWMNVSKLVDV